MKVKSPATTSGGEPPLLMCQAVLTPALGEIGLGGVGTHYLVVAPARGLLESVVPSAAESGHVGGRPFAICKGKSELCNSGCLMAWAFPGVFSATVRWSSGGWDDFHYFFLFWTKCSEFLQLAECQLYLPLFNHSIDFSAQTRVIRPKIYHPEAYFNYPK